jgi:hypothetical protein
MPREHRPAEPERDEVPEHDLEAEPCEQQTVRDGDVAGHRIE